MDSFHARPGGAAPSYAYLLVRAGEVFTFGFELGGWAVAGGLATG